MSNIARMMQQATAGAGGGTTDVDNVFSTFVYEGTGSAQTITNDIDLSGEGGLVWGKSRTSADTHLLFDTARGTGKYLISNDTGGEATNNSQLTAFNNNGFSIGTDYGLNDPNQDYVSWTFRKAEKFFDVVTYTGNSTNGRTVSHNLGSTVGMVIIKKKNASTNWVVWHRGFSSQYAYLNSDNAFATAGAANLFGNGSSTVSPTSTQVTLGANSSVNGSGDTYVMYLFAHNNNDGEFGPNEDQDIIKCGQFSKGYSGIVTVNLGFEPQWIMVKKQSSNAGAWYVGDQMRGMCAEMLPNHEARTSALRWNASNDEDVQMDIFEPTATGFIVRDGHQYIDGGEDYVYMAIRRGPLAEPTSATDVFKVGNSQTTDQTTFPVDSLWSAYREGYSYNFTFYDRLRSIDRSRQLVTNQGLQEGQNNTYSLSFISNTGVVRNWGSLWIHYMLRRAPGFYDVVCYDGNGTAKTVSHNLGVVPEMMWIKQRSGSNSWRVYHKAMGNTKAMYLDHTYGETTDNNFNNTTPTASVFSVNAHVGTNQNNHGYVAYLFATLAGVSKVGSVSHSFNSTTNVDCGFSSGARFVLVKSTASGDWRVWDSTRGIVSGNDPYLALNNTSTEVTNGDLIDPYSGGFALSPSFYTDTYIFYAIA